MTTRPGSGTTDLKVGDGVIVRRVEPAGGTWERFNGRQGWVAAINRQTFPSGVTYVEIGVSWNPPSKRNPSVETWFRADELVQVAP